MPEVPRSKNQTLLVSDPVFQTHDTGQGHPESIRRHVEVTRALSAPEFSKGLWKMKPPASDDATMSEMLAIALSFLWLSEPHERRSAEYT